MLTLCASHCKIDITYSFHVHSAYIPESLYLSVCHVVLYANNISMLLIIVFKKSNFDYYIKCGTYRVALLLPTE